DLVAERVVDQLPAVAAVEREDEEVGVGPAAILADDDERAVVGHEGGRGAVADAPLAASVGAHDPDAAVGAAEGDEDAAVRPGRLAAVGAERADRARAEVEDREREPAVRGRAREDDLAAAGPERGPEIDGLVGRDPLDRARAVDGADPERGLGGAGAAARRGE